ncbi:hypothetical protein GPJ56_004340 [Histomonas meleagridis]|uniref:uncharacterized protein n=1 Tax=Histomonas meleagridis TaxID=135588 RepID=UPI00355A71BB|nr:hypothetical protein GPJ56_004340 [Histomonas meleagridis]KAH0800015.1 hypothetical protein GO595_007127 [Histomonas meleagridis]
MIRPLAAFEKYHIDIKAYVQMALKVKNSDQVLPTIQKLKKYALGLRTRVIDNEKLLVSEQEVPIYSIPSGLGLKQACDYMSEKHTRPVSQALASIGTTGNTIVFHSCHLCADGAFLQRLFNALKDESADIVPNAITPIGKTFEKHIKEATLPPKFVTSDPRLSRVKTIDPLSLSNIDLTQSYYLQTPLRALKCSNSKGEIHRLTDSLWAQLILTAAALNGTFNEKACSTCINLRPYLDQIHFGIGNAFSWLTVGAEADRNTTVSEFMNRLRYDFKNQVDTGLHFGYLKIVEEGLAKENNVKHIGPAVELSHVGRFKLNDTFSDVFINATLAAPKVLGLTSCLTFTVEDDYGRNDLISNFRYNAQELTLKDAQIINKTIIYGLQNVDFKMTCGDAIDMLAQYAEKLKKENKEFPHWKVL